MRQPARIIMTVWGERYLDDLLSVTLPALIAPGNLPALAQLFDCEFVLVTETAFFEMIRQAPVFRKIEENCKVRLMSLDDLVMTRLHYGMTLTYAYMRGFEDLGERVTEWYLIFLNSDFVLADGSYRTLAQRMLSGERLVVAPSYCVVEEQVKPLLKYVLTDPQTGSLTIPPREMAALAIANRHYTIRGKTVNQQIYSMDRIEQFYWYVDEHTLLAHQLPIAVVCMKPERAVSGLDTFWDYGLVSELCPTVKPYVFHDSDDFLMIELRSENTYTEYLSLGWLSIDEIAADLSSFTTKDHREYGRYTLILHSNDIPSSVPHAKASLRSFVDSVYERMSPQPLDHRAHPYWMASYPDFQRAKALYRPIKTSEDTCKNQSQYPPKDGNVTNALTVRVLLRNMLEFIKGRLTVPSREDLRYAVPIIRGVQGKPCKALVISSSGGVKFLPSLVAKASDSFAEVDEFYATNDLLDRVINGEGDFDLCIIETNFDMLQYLPRLFKVIRPRMRKSGKVVALYLNTMGRPVHKKSLAMMKTYFPSTDHSRVYFSGTALGARARRLFVRSLVLRAEGGLRATVKCVFLMALSAGLSWVANRCLRADSPQRFTKYLTSLTIEIDIA